MENSTVNMGSAHNVNYFAQLEAFLDEYLINRAPFKIPAGLKEFIVKFTPWINLIFIILLAPALLFALGLSALIAPLAFITQGTTAGYGYLAIGFATVSIVLQIIALRGLFKRTAKGWDYSFYATLVNVFSSIFAFDISSILGMVIGLFVLFQIKDMYAGKMIAAPLPKAAAPSAASTTAPVQPVAPAGTVVTPTAPPVVTPNIEPPVQTENPEQP